MNYSDQQDQAIPAEDTALTQPNLDGDPPLSMKGAGGINFLQSPEQPSKQGMQLNSNVAGDAGGLVTPIAAALESELETGHQRKSSAKGNGNGQDTGTMQSIISKNREPEFRGGTELTMSPRVKYNEPQVFAADKVTLPIIRTAASVAQETTQCTASFSTNKKTQQQRKTHVCNWDGCGKAFTRPSTLKSHLNEHTNTRPYPCTDCNQRFIRKHDLLRALQGGESSVACTECGKEYSRLDAVRRHQRGDGDDHVT